MATGRCSTGSSARYTAPIAPSPSRPRIWYFPIVLAGGCCGMAGDAARGPREAERGGCHANIGGGRSASNGMPSPTTVASARSLRAGARRCCLPPPLLRAQRSHAPRRPLGRRPGAADRRRRPVAGRLAHARLLGRLRREPAHARDERRRPSGRRPRAGPRTRALGRDARRGHGGAGAHARLRHRRDEGAGPRDRGARLQGVAAARDRRAGVGLSRARGGRRRHDGALARRAGGAGRRDVGRGAVSHRERIERRGRRDGRGGVRELRADRGLRAARLDRRVGAGQGRARAIRPIVPRHQGARGGEARRGGAADLQRSGGRRLRARRRLSRRADASRVRRAARQRVQRQRRSVDAGLAEPRRRAPRADRQPRGAAHPGRADRLRQRAHAAGGRARRGRAAGVAGRAAVPLPRGPRTGVGARARHDRRGDRGLQDRSGTRSARCAAASCPTRS